ncbi:uncharacterized protein yc1106_03547 [Curvularia clavata]|uniref:Uncharacterized protein n=1 Tax=Curvularia clavata TaxID=95742 RepID=A0A9Q8Z8L2_CURCL|nr:uncharacterized protein yc1106_03547 [Curvularia clavata]
MDTSVRYQTVPNMDYARYLDSTRSSHHIGHKANLSGATMLDLLSGPEGSLAAAYQTSNSRPHSSKSRRPSYASSTTTQLRQTNRTLVEIVQSAQSELAIQRQAMLDMQSRILQLESALYNNNTGSVPRIIDATKRSKSQIKPSQSMPLKIEQRRDTTTRSKPTKLDRAPSMPEFWESPSRFSGFNFNFDLLETVPKNQPVPQQPHQAPEVYKPLPLQPTSTTTLPKNVTLENGQTSTRMSRDDIMDRTSMYHEAVSDIKEHVIEYEKVKVPFPPLLHSPPKSSRSKVAPTTHDGDDELTALPQMPTTSFPEAQRSVSRNRKGIKSMLIYRTFSKSFKSDCTHTFDRRSSHYAQV